MAVMGMVTAMKMIEENTQTPTEMVNENAETPPLKALSVVMQARSVPVSCVNALLAMPIRP
jgi:hypothetical protein